MAQEKITYVDKETFRTSPLPNEQKMRSEDANEIKDVANNNADDVDSKDAAQTQALATHIADDQNPHLVTKDQVGLGSADNTSDADKPISDAGATKNSSQDSAIGAVDTKADNNATNIGNNVTAIGLVQDNLDTHELNTSNPHSVTKDQVGLGEVDNTADANKPISTQTQAALDQKKDISASANQRAAVDIASSNAGDFWLFRLPNTTQSREYVVVIQYHRPDDAGRFGKSVTLSVGLGNTSGLPDRGGSIIQTGGFGVASALSAVFIRFVGGQYYLGFTSVLNGGTSRLAISVHGPDAQDVDFSVLNNAASGADIISLDPTILNEARNLLTTEQGLGNPITDGELLSSTIAGVRSWVQQPIGIARRFFLVTTVADGWYRLVSTEDANQWGETFQFGITWRLGNNAQSASFGVGTSYNVARIGLGMNTSGAMVKSVRVTWANSRWHVEFQATAIRADMEVWYHVSNPRGGFEFGDGAAGGGQVYGNTRFDLAVPLNDTVPAMANILAVPDVSQGYISPPINDLGREQDPPEYSSAEAEDFNASMASVVLERMKFDALDIAYAAEADLQQLGGTAYVQGIISTPPDAVIVDRADYIFNGVDPKYL